MNGGNFRRHSESDKAYIGGDAVCDAAQIGHRVPEPRTTGLTFKQAYESGRRFRVPPSAEWLQRREDGTIHAGNHSMNALPFSLAVRSDWEIETKENCELREALGECRQALLRCERAANEAGVL